MRKVFFFAFMALSLTAMAQHVKPLTIQIADPRLDSLRTVYSAEPTMYRAALDVVAKDLMTNAGELKAAKAELREEQNHAKEIDNTLKEAAKTVSNLKVLYSKEEAELKSLQRTIEQQQRSVAGKSSLTKDARDNYVQTLDKHQKDLGYALRELAERQRSMADFETTIQNATTSHQAYWLEVNQKAADLAALEQLHKDRVAIVKAEQKTAKNMQ
ncbi:MAG: hypothetical protein J6T80_01385 [Paludibacteraceae bacterium]|nr:hypothetical protein [Paludibacteraceae bacterium]